MHLSTTLLGSSEAPPEIAEALERIRPGVRLLHLGGSKWWLGSEGPNPRAAELLALKRLGTTVGTNEGKLDPAERAMAQTRLEKELVMYEIMASGFRPIQLYDLEQGAEGAQAVENLYEIVEDFRIREHNLRNTSEAEQRRAAKEAVSVEALNAPRIKRFGQFARDKAAEAYSYVMRKARSALVATNLE